MKLVSVAGGGDLGREIDLKSLSNDLDAAEIRYDPEFHPGLYMKFEEDGATVIAFRSGKYNIAGASSLDELSATHEKFVSTIEEMVSQELAQAYDTLELRNIVFVDDLDRDVNLEELVTKLGPENVEYEPEQFPALDYRPPDYSGMFKIFSTGKISLTGVTDPDTVDAAYQRLNERLTE